MDQQTALSLIRALLCDNSAMAECPWTVGGKYLIRTVTHYWTGQLVAVGQQELILKNAAWIADTGRFHDCATKATFNEIEPVYGNVIIGRASVIDAIVWSHPLPQVQK